MNGLIADGSVVRSNFVASLEDPDSVHKCKRSKIAQTALRFCA